MQAWRIRNLDSMGGFLYFTADSDGLTFFWTTEGNASVWSTEEAAIEFADTILQRCRPTARIDFIKGTLPNGRN